VSARRLLAPLALVALAGCAHVGDIDETGGISAIRTACPTVGVPAGTGDITLFNPANLHTAEAIDVTATITNVRGSCDNGTPTVGTAVTFDVLASRTQAAEARDVTLPYFVTVVQGGTAVIAKSLGQVTVHFAAGQARATAHGRATSSIDHATASLPDNIRRRLTEKRRAGGEDAAVDPLAQPEVRQAVLRATFETLVGFQLTDDQLKYNVTR
jgi:hypothetical protein